MTEIFKQSFANMVWEAGEETVLNDIGSVLESVHMRATDTYQTVVVGWVGLRR